MSDTPVSGPDAPAPQRPPDSPVVAPARSPSNPPPNPLDIGTVGDLRPGGSAWIDPAALRSVGDGLAVDPNAKATLAAPALGGGVRIERTEAGVRVDRWQARGHVPAHADAIDGLIPGQDVTAQDDDV